VVGGPARGWLQVDDLRRVFPFFSLAFTIVAAVTQPSSSADLALAAVPVAAWTLWALVRTAPLAAVAVAIVVPVVVVQRSGELEPVMFNVALLAFAAARWSRSLAAAAALGLLAAATPALVAVVQDPMEIAGGIWVVAIAFVWVIGRAAVRQERLVIELEGTRRRLAQQALLAERRRIARDVHDFVGHGLAAVMLQVTSARHVLRRDADAAEEALRSAEDVGRRSMQALANAARHAPRARTVVALELADGRVALLAETSGRLVAGPATERQRPHYGLIGMQERTRDGWRVRCELPLEDEGAGDPSRHR
jgi:signal transduction histidine kinase